MGPAIPGIEMKLGEGNEILVRGPNIFAGYWNRPEQTERVIAGGWFHTGDQGEVTAAGNWRIIGRLKNLLILVSDTTSRRSRSKTICSTRFTGRSR